MKVGLSGWGGGGDRDAKSAWLRKYLQHFVNCTVSFLLAVLCFINSYIDFYQFIFQQFRVSLFHHFRFLSRINFKNSKIQIKNWSFFFNMYSIQSQLIYCQTFPKFKLPNCWLTLLTFGAAKLLVLLAFGWLNACNDGFAWGTVEKPIDWVGMEFKVCDCWKFIDWPGCISPNCAKLFKTPADGFGGGIPNDGCCWYCIPNSAPLSFIDGMLCINWLFVGSEFIAGAAPYNAKILSLVSFAFSFSFGTWLKKSCSCWANVCSTNGFVGFDGAVADGTADVVFPFVVPSLMK